MLPNRGHDENLVCRVLHLVNPEESGPAPVVPPIVLLLGKVEGFQRMLTTVSQTSGILVDVDFAAAGDGVIHNGVIASCAGLPFAVGNRRGSVTIQRRRPTA